MARADLGMSLTVPAVAGQSQGKPRIDLGDHGPYTGDTFSQVVHVSAGRRARAHSRSHLVDSLANQGQAAFTGRTHNRNFSVTTTMIV